MYSCYTNAHMEKRIKHLSEALLRAVSKMNRSEKRARSYGTEVMLHPSEVHAAMLIGNNPEQHVSELARIAGITRGAVSQVVAKLEKKGLVKKVTNPDSNLRTIPQLTDMGWKAYRNHEQLHEEQDADLFNYIRHLREDQVEVLTNFFVQLEKVADKYN